MTETDLNKLTEIAIGFGIGVASSSLVGWVIFRKQKKDSEKFQRDLILNLVSLKEQGDLLFDSLDLISQEISDNNDNTKDRLDYLIKEYQKTDEELQKKSSKRNKSEYIESLLKYKVLADKWSEEKALIIDSKTLDEKGKLNVQKIKNQHKAIFPEGFTFAGQFRTEAVKIVGKIKVSGKVLNPMISTISTDVMPPEEISESLEILINDWNSKVDNLQNYDIDGKCYELAEFHQQFLLIHPFIDGNGRISRIILNDQASFLFKKKMKLNFNENREEYFEALRFADLRDINRLKDMIKSKIVDVKNGTR